MEKRKWLWKRRSSERSPGETESSGSVSSHSERYSDDQDAPKASPTHDAQSPEVTSVAAPSVEANDGVKHLSDKLSAALSNISAKDDLVQQHAKVAEEAVAGWEKAEKEVEILRQQLDAAEQQNLGLEDRAAHLDRALKECVRQMRVSREEQDKMIEGAVMIKTQEWESTKIELERQLLELQTEANSTKDEPAIEPDVYRKLEMLEKENSSIKLELLSLTQEMKIRTIERDLSTEAAETASKQMLESIKRVAKVEAECRRLKAMSQRSFSVNSYKSTPPASLYAESDCQSEKREEMNEVAIDANNIRSFDTAESKMRSSSTWASALMNELNQFKNEKTVSRSLTSSSTKMELMDDFLEMEQLASLPEDKFGDHCLEAEAASGHSNDGESSLRTELDVAIKRTADLERTLAEVEAVKIDRAELDTAILRTAHLEAKLAEMEAEKDGRAELNAAISDLETKLAEMEAEKDDLEVSLSNSRKCAEASAIQLKEAKVKLEELQKELVLANELKQSLELELTGMQAEARTMSMHVSTLKEELDKERALAAEKTSKCQELENELLRRIEEAELRKNASSNDKPKVKQDELAVAAGKLAECQKTIASLGKQLKSLATLEDFLLDTSCLPESCGGEPLVPKPGHDIRKSHSRNSESLKMVEDSSATLNHNADIPELMSPSTSLLVMHDQASPERSCNGFGKLFLESRNVIQDN